jgi:hypothetical protein
VTWAIDQKGYSQVRDTPESGALDEADVSFNARRRRSRNADKAAALT